MNNFISDLIGLKLFKWDEVIIIRHILKFMLQQKKLVVEYVNMYVKVGVFILVLH